MRLSRFTANLALATSLFAGGQALGQSRPAEQAEDLNLGPMCEIHLPRGTWVCKTVFSARGIEAISARVRPVEPFRWSR